jgi:hypothetical protein
MRLYAGEITEHDLIVRLPSNLRGSQKGMFCPLPEMIGYGCPDGCSPRLVRPQISYHVACAKIRNQARDEDLISRSTGRLPRGIVNRIVCSEVFANDQRSRGK